MKKIFFNRKIKLIISIGICVLFMILVISSTAKRQLNKEEGLQFIKFIGFAQQNDNITIVGNSNSWYDIPGVNLNFTLSTAKYVDFRAFGVQPDNGNSICFRYVIDGVGYGNSIYGELCINQPSGYIPWNLERVVSLQSGEHSVKIQIYNHGGSSITCYNTEYWGTRLFVYA